MLPSGELKNMVILNKISDRQVKKNYVIYSIIKMKINYLLRTLRKKNSREYGNITNMGK